MFFLPECITNCRDEMTIASRLAVNGMHSVNSVLTRKRRVKTLKELRDKVECWGHNRGAQGGGYPFGICIQIVNVLLSPMLTKHLCPFTSATSTIHSHYSFIIVIIFRSYSTRVLVADVEVCTERLVNVDESKTLKICLQMPVQFYVLINSESARRC